MTPFQPATSTNPQTSPGVPLSTALTALGAAAALTQGAQIAAGWLQQMYQAAQPLVEPLVQGVEELPPI